MASFFDGRTNKPIEVDLSLHGSQLKIVWTHEVFFDLETVRILLVRKTEIQIKQDRSVLKVKTDDLLFPAVKKIIFQRRAKRNKKTVLMVSSLIAAFCLILFNINNVANLLPDSLFEPIYSNTNMAEALGSKDCVLKQKTVEELLTSFDLENNYQIRILDLNMKNAFAYPPNQIYFTKGLIEAFQADDELKVVLAHEVAHHHYKHYKPGILRNYFLNIYTGVFLSGVKGSQLSQALINSFYSQGAEKQADEYAFEKLKKLNIDGDAGVRAFERLKDRELPSNKFLQFFSTHPQIDERIKLFKRIKFKNSNQFRSSQFLNQIKEECI